MQNRFNNIFLGLFCMFFLISCERIKHEELILYDFESESVFDQFHWKCHTLFSLSDEHAVHGKTSLKLELFPSSYPGLSPALKHNDWRGYQALCLEVYNPSPEIIKLILRIDDQKQALEHNERYNKSFRIMPGANTLNIPLNSLKKSGTDQLLELKNIYRFLVFMSHPEKKYVLYLDYFRLIPVNSI